ncbi:putative early protein [uncultured phage cr116_1]|uniref:Putative early protein n=1 Tax=uncultured phage cr116_1 TaxID=2772073 RepID=A0A7M1RZP8_9CAUD|nr:VOG4559 [uncultured phage cr116_1]QOR59382.1 putative early protein [uncultured phage cr116_1]DAK53073.1 MAG TPA: nucelotide kinase [Crassvirales sp.]
MIKKGEKYICTDDVYMEGEDYRPVYRKGKVYQSDVDDSLVDECNDTHYWLDRELFEKYFKKYTLPIKNSSDDRVNHPSHYTWLKDLCGIEVIDITRHMNFNLGNVIKYVLRSGHKSEEGMSDKQKRIEDLKKAVFYLNDEINRLENDKEGV